MGRVAVILAVAIVVLDPRDFRGIARILGAAMSDLRLAFDDLSEIVGEEPCEERNTGRW